MHVPLSPAQQWKCSLCVLKIIYFMWDGEKSYPSKTEWLYTCGFIPKLIKHIFLIITPSSLLCSKHKEMKTQFLMSCRPWGKTHKSSRYKITWWFQLILPVLDKQGYFLKKKKKKKTHGGYHLYLASQSMLDFRERSCDAMESCGRRSKASL